MGVGGRAGCYFISILGQFHKYRVKDIVSSVAKWVPLIMLLWPLPCLLQHQTLAFGAVTLVPMLERSKGCPNERIMRYLQDLCRRCYRGPARILYL